jgi:hypothetical protein
LTLIKRNELGRVADETLLPFTDNDNSKSQMDPSFRWDDDQAQSWMTSHSAVKNPASAGMTSKDNNQMNNYPSAESPPTRE